MPITWNPSDKAANVALSGGNLIATGTLTGTAGNNVRVNAYTASGLIYWEVVANTVNGGAGFGFGFANASFTIGAGVYIGENSNSLGWYDNSEVYINGSIVASYTLTTAAPFYSGDVLSGALNLTTRRLYLRVNSGKWNGAANANPVAGTGGIDVSAITGNIAAALELSFNTEQGTLRALAASFTQSVPSGYSALDPGVVAGSALPSRVSRIIHNLAR